MSNETLGGNFALGGDLSVTRMGYGAMQLAGPRIFGPPADPDSAKAVLREVVDLGITHIDTSDYYGPHATNQLIRETLHPYPEDLHIVTKVGVRRDAQGGWPPAGSPDELREAVRENLSNLGVETLDLVNLRVTGPAASVAEGFGALAELREQGLIRHLGLSTVTADQVAQAQAIAPVACVQNLYNIANRGDDDLIDSLAGQGIAYVPYFRIPGVPPVQSDVLDEVATRLRASAKTVELAWLLQRSPNLLLIPGTSSVDHLRMNAASATLVLPSDAVAALDSIAA